MIKFLLAIDLDKTLLNDEGNLTEFTEKTILSFKKKGGKVVIATGRALQRSQNIAKRINADGIVALNGSVTYLGDSVISKQSISKKTIKVLMDRLLSIEGVSITVSYPEYMITNNKKYVIPGLCDYSDFEKFDLDEIQKINVFTSYTEQLKEIDFSKYDCKLIGHAQEDNYFVVVHSSVNKLNGVKQLCKYLNIESKNVICFGDDYNDLELMEEYTGVAVANASEKIKEKAMFQCLSNNEEGVAKWINDYFHLN